MVLFRKAALTACAAQYHTGSLQENQVLVQGLELSELIYKVKVGTLLHWAHEYISVISNQDLFLSDGFPVNGLPKCICVFLAVPLNVWLFPFISGSASETLNSFRQLW